jgi:hypothetical protein
MNHHPTSRYRRAIVAASITGLLLAAACGEDTGSNVQTEIAPAAPSAIEQLDALEDHYRAGATEHRSPSGPSDPFARNAEELNALEDDYQAGATEHPNATSPSIPTTRPATGPRPY